MNPALPIIALAWLGKFICHTLFGSGKPKQSNPRVKHLVVYTLVLLPLSTIVISTVVLSLAYFGLVHIIIPLLGLA